MEQCCNDRMISLHVTNANDINDDFLHVIMELLDWSYTQADQMSTLVTYKGKCKVRTDNAENISKLSKRFAELNISHTVE